MKNKFNFKSSNVPDLIEKGFRVDFILGSGEVIHINEQENLELQIRTYDSNYRAGTPICTDEAYDKLIEELQQKYPDSSLIKKGVIEQTQKENRKQKLPIYMGSLNKLKSVEEIQQWLKSIDCENENIVITPKYDGISLVVDESNDKCWTRGDGEVGQKSDLHFSNLNDKHCGTDIISFGEAIMSKKNFEKYKDKFANPRNMVAGLFNRDQAGEELKDVDYIRYGMSPDTDKIIQIGRLNYINEVDCKYLILNANEFFKIGTEKLEESLTAIYSDWGSKYQIDGLVIDINDPVTRDRLGREENMNPKYARAIKLPKWSQEAIVKVKGVQWQVSKQGKLKPVIEVEPTELAGVTISNVTGYNAKYIFDNNIASGSIIRIVRSGDVIPKHIETISYIPNAGNDLMDDLVECPSCGEPTKWDETITELVCTNPECKEMKIMKLVHFFSTLEIEDFGEPSIRKLYNSGFESAESILNIDLEDILEIEGFGDISIKKLFDQFDKLKYEGVPFAKLLHALDVMDGKIGEKTIQLVLDNIWGNNSFTVENLVKIDGVAEITANVFLKGWYESEKYSDLPIKVSYVTSPKQEVTGNKFQGMKICFTGCRPTKEQEQEIQSQGGEIVSGVSNKTTYLVVKDSSSTSSKMQKAKELGVTIITIKELFK